MDKQNFRRLQVLFFVGSLLFFVLSIPRLNYIIGNTFFGEVPKLYNVTLAQFFFARSASPLIGDAVPYAHYQLSRTHFIQGELEEALLNAEQEIKLFPEHMHTYYIMGLTLGYMNREEEAIEAFGKFIEYKPESWAARNDRAWLQFRIGDINGALETILPVAMITSNPWVQNTYGTLLLNKMQYVEAKQAFEYAKLFADALSEDEWGEAYPGNDPRIYGAGVEGMRATINKNLEMVSILGY